MENVSNVSSEEELLKLRDEGKISEQEYAELLGTIRRSSGNKSSRESPAEPQFQAFRKRILVGAFVICILGIVIGLILKPLCMGSWHFGNNCRANKVPSGQQKAIT